MELGLKGKVAIVGGASRGIGRACAWGLAQEGARVTICARGVEALQKTATAIAQATGSEVLPVAADLARPEDVQRVVQETVRHFGRLDIVVANAGGPPPGAVLDFTEEQWQTAVAQNFLSTVRLSREAVPHLRAAGGGRIINIVSTTVKEPIDRLGLSNAVRLAVVGFAKTLALELAADRILVNNVCPGAIFTDRRRELAQARAQAQGRPVDEVIAEEARSYPLGRYGRPEEVAALVVFLASEQASYITGATLLADGGLTRAML